MNTISRIAKELGTNNTPRIASLLKRGKIQYRTSGSPSCWSNWYNIRGIEDARRTLEIHDAALGFGYSGIEFRVETSQDY